MEGDKSIMDAIWISLGISVATIITNIIISLVQNRKQSALVQYRLEELEKKVDKHNNLVERTYHLETEVAVIKEDLSNGKIHRES